MGEGSNILSRITGVLPGHDPDPDPDPGPDPDFPPLRIVVPLLNIDLPFAPVVPAYLLMIQFLSPAQATPRANVLAEKNLALKFIGHLGWLPGQQPLKFRG